MSKDKSQQLVTAAQYLKKKGVTFRAPKKIIISYSNKVDLSAFTLINEWKRGQLYVKGNIGIIANLGIGSAMLNIAMEELSALGAKEFIIIGFAGDLNPKLKSGDIVNSDKHKIYSTNDPYGEETVSWFKKMQRNKYDAVDMETEYLIKKAKQLGLKAKSYLVIMDILTLDGWDDSYNPEKVQESFLGLLKKTVK